MADSIRQVDYHYVTVEDKAGEGLRVLSSLKRAGINLLACCGFPAEAGKAQFDLVPEDPQALREIASSLGLKLSDRKKAFLIQGEDRIGEVSDVFEKLAGKGISLVASQAVCAGSGRWGMVLWVKPADFDRAGKAMGL